MATPMSLSLFIFSIPMLCSSAIFPLPSLPRRGLVIFPAEFTVPTDTSGPGTVTIPPASPTTPSVPVTNPVTTPSTNVPGAQPQPVTPPDAQGGFPSTTPTLAPPDPAAGGFPGSTPAQPPPNPTAGGLPSTTPTQAPPDPSGGFPGTNPAIGPPTGTNAPSGSGQSWCVAKNGVPETTIQVALDYACGMGGADCSAIQQGANCYNPNTLQNHASYAFNSYYQKNPGPTSCNFGGAATITNTNPSQGSCIFPTSSSLSSPSTTTPTPNSTPTMTPPTTATPTPPDPMTAYPAGMTPPNSSGTTPTGSSSMSPNILNASGPGTGGAAAGFSGVPPITNNSSDLSGAMVGKPVTGCIIAVAISMMTAGRMIMRM